MHIFRDLFISQIRNKMDEKLLQKNLWNFRRLKNVFCFKGHSRVKRIVYKKTVE